MSRTLQILRTPVDRSTHVSGSKAACGLPLRAHTEKLFSKTAGLPNECPVAPCGQGSCSQGM